MLGVGIMYYPYLRGRQYELIGLRELCEKGLLENIVPVVEPVKASSTLLSTIKAFSKNNKQLIIIKNPTVGSFLKELEYDSEYKTKFFEELKKCSSSVINGYILNSAIKEQGQALDTSAVAFCFSMDNVHIYDGLKMQFSKVFIPDSSSIKRRIKESKVLFEDRFSSKNRNADYAEEPDLFFSNDLFYYRDENFDGFSDFSVVGNEFAESGFAPFAVAIHLVYLGSSEDELRIHHFVSKSNEDTNNPQKKFSEALSELVQFPCFQNEINKTFALEQFKNLYSNGVYPGLGTVKKLSIMHHLELISKCLSKYEG